MSEGEIKELTAWLKDFLNFVDDEYDYHLRKVWVDERVDNLDLELIISDFIHTQGGPNVLRNPAP